MKYKIYYIIGGILVLFLGSVFIRSCTNFAVKKMNEISETTIEETIINLTDETTQIKGQIVNTKCEDWNVWQIVNALVNDAPVYWNDPNLISENFKSKFKSGIDILPELNSFVDGCGAGNETINGKKVVCIDGLTKSYYSEKYDCNIDQVTAYYYDYVINEKEQLDDLIFLYKKVFPERIALTGERLDGKKDIYSETVAELLHYIANPYHNFDIIYTHNYSEESMPYSDTCKIINRPNLEEIGIPENSYDEKEGEDVYIIFEYPTKKIKWKVNYKVDDDSMFDYIEFVEVKS